jgi:membrane-bound lytic murein transglycosylase D
MTRFSSGAFLMFLAFTLFVPPAALPAGEAVADSPFSTPSILQPNVDFWRQVYTQYGVEEFVLHDRENLGIVYEVVRVEETTNQAKALERARPEIRRLRERYEGILASLAQGSLPDELGPEAADVFRLWGCPCPPERLQRAAASIRVQQGLRQKVREGLQRAGSLMPRILAILKRHEVPVELAALPLVESSFNPHAASKAGAVGLWQFIKSTGKRYLTITRKRDDRRDPIRATEAAARFLRHNYEALGSWPLAVVAYNHGPEGIQAAKASVGSAAIEEIIARYTGPRFGFASRNFYAEFLAALEVVAPLIQEHTPPIGQARPRLARQG